MRIPWRERSALPRYRRQRCKVGFIVPRACTGCSRGTVAFPAFPLNSPLQSAAVLALSETCRRAGRGEARA
eukprot:ctg_2954.g396